MDGLLIGLGLNIHFTRIGAPNSSMDYLNYFTTGVGFVYCDTFTGCAPIDSVYSEWVDKQIFKVRLNYLFH